MSAPIETKPWPNPMQAAGGIGHNRPPLDIEATAAFDEAIDQSDDFREKVEAMLGEAERAYATSDETAGRCASLVKKIRAAVKVIEDAHVSAKAPYLAAGRAVDAAKNEMIAPLDAAKRGVEAKQGQYLREQEVIRQAEARRLWEAEQAELRARREHDAATNDRAPEPTFIPASAPEAERAIIRGDFGGTVSGTKVWLSQVADYELAFIAVANNEKVREAIDKAIANMVRGGVREIDGVRIWSDIKASNR